MRLPDAVAQALEAMRLGAATDCMPLTGGVSSDIWRVELASGPICVKRALPRLRVAADWQAPVERSTYEARWMREAALAAPGAVPVLLGEAGGCLAMQYLPPERHAPWKAELLHGRADPVLAARVGERLAAIHAGTAARPALAAAFDSQPIFEAIRIEPYLLATARAHPDRAGALEALAAGLRAERRAMIHGDASPKNILSGPDGPVFLDAECATWGDPAFDVAFCLNHLLLKCLVAPQATAGLLQSWDRLAHSYLAGVDWEPPADLGRRAARLLPGLLLARVDGKSPVEYITTDAARAPVRRVGRALLAAPPDDLAAIRTAWEDALRT